MILGFHYHIPFSSKNNQNFVPGHFGLFLQELAKNVDELVLFLFYSDDFDSKYFDFHVSQPNIKIVQIGNNSPAYVKFFFARIIVRKHKTELKRCTKFLLRGPSPMCYAYSSYFYKKDICNLVVGDYLLSLKFLNQPFYRRLPVKALNYLMHYSYISSLKDTALAFNSEALQIQYGSLASRTDLINTGNVRMSDITFTHRSNIISKPIVRLLYVGRIDWAKGFEEMLQMLSSINSKSLQRFELDIVGWDESKNNHVLNSIKSRVSNLGLEEFVIFHGKKQPGKELYSFYTLADIFLLPSYQEGFPRTIWEAFANNLAVITTPVGSISMKIKNYTHALFCEVGNSESIEEKILELINEPEIYQNLIRNGRELVLLNTIEEQTRRLVEFIN